MKYKINDVILRIAEKRVENSVCKNSLFSLGNDNIAMLKRREKKIIPAILVLLPKSWTRLEGIIFDKKDRSPFSEPPFISACSGMSSLRTGFMIKNIKSPMNEEHIVVRTVYFRTFLPSDFISFIHCIPDIAETIERKMRGILISCNKLIKILDVS
jgi:hypothetical protein